MAKLLTLAKLVWADLWFDRRISLCVVAALVAVIAPMLLLFGLKHGVVSQMQAQLANDPRILSVTLRGSHTITEEWLAELQALPETAFALGSTHYLNIQAAFTHGTRYFSEKVEVIPSAENDPVLKHMPALTHSDQVILSSEAAQLLHAKVGDTVQLRVQRRLNNSEERGRKTLTVIGVLEPSAYDREAAFLQQQVVLDIDHARMGERVESLGFSTGTVPDNSKAVQYSGARIYARDLDSVEAIHNWLADRHIPVHSRLADIQNVNRINYVLSIIFAIIVITALIGSVASLAGSILANVDRKRKDLAVLRLLGFTGAGIAQFVLLQASFLVLLSYAIGLALFWAGCNAVNRIFKNEQMPDMVLCHITPQHAAWAFVLLLALTLIVAALGARRAVRIQPAESLREL